MLHALLLKGNFQDSVTLMVLSRDLSGLSTVNRVSVMMGTPANKDVYRETGMWHDALAEATPNDLCIVVDSDTTDPAIAETIAGEIKTRLAELAVGKRKAGYSTARSWRRARQLLPDANMVLISVAGQYAPALARQALEDGCHAMIFSDNVPVEDERALKTLAGERGLLVMGPDCGTAIIDRVPLAFANRIPAGPIAVVGASGTGIQELTSQIAWLGGGITHALGLGGRDLSETIGGASAAPALALVAADPRSRVVAFVSKQPAAAVKDKVMAILQGLGKPVVALFLGDRPTRRVVGNVHLARSLDEAASIAVDLAAIDVQASQLPDVSGTAICGLYTGGTLASEASFLLGEVLDLTDQATHTEGRMFDAAGHRIIDLGDDIYTRGRPHPMIDPFARGEMIRDLAADTSIGVLLLDVVLGFGSHSDPAGEVVKAVQDLRATRGEAAPVVVIATVTGTNEDPQDRASQTAMLEAAGIEIAGSVRAAVLLAARAVKGQTAQAAGGVTPAGLLAQAPAVINIGLTGFAQDLKAAGAKVVHLEWTPVAEGADKFRQLAASLQ
ncbi:MAG: acyl-CoA synthetase FdrA [Telmatospirillum sp.]|nr:acyl-CoA synthetase FdrA [Telmatospirillum sp.]